MSSASYLVLVFSSLVLVACVGSLEEVSTGDSPSAGGADASPDDDDGADAGPAAACDELASAGDGHHNEGMPCQSCHLQGGSAPAFTIGGTAYDSSGAPLAGATIHIVGADGTDLPLVTATNGNFWSTDPIAFPARASLSLCPDTVPMVAPVAESGGNCNAGGCHDQARRIVLP